MNSKVVKLLLGLSAILLLILLIEWLFAESPQELLVELDSSTEVIQKQAMELPELILIKQPLEMYTDMVEKPLFIQGRKPILDGDRDSSGQDDMGSMDDMLLVGIYSVDGRTSALFSMQGSDKKHFKKIEGDEISGWMIKEIKTDRVVLGQNTRQQTVLLRKPKPTSSKVRPRKKRSDKRTSDKK